MAPHRLIPEGPVPRRPDADRVALAVDAGFYDQSHLAAEFQALLDEIPEAFRARDRRLHAQTPDYASSVASTLDSGAPPGSA